LNFAKHNTNMVVCTISLTLLTHLYITSVAQAMRLLQKFVLNALNHCKSYFLIYSNNS